MWGCGITGSWSHIRKALDIPSRITHYGCSHKVYSSSSAKMNNPSWRAQEQADILLSPPPKYSEPRSSRPDVDSHFCGESAPSPLQQERLDLHNTFFGPYFPAVGVVCPPPRPDVPIWMDLVWAARGHSKAGPKWWCDCCQCSQILCKVFSFLYRETITSGDNEMYHKYIEYWISIPNIL